MTDYTSQPLLVCLIIIIINELNMETISEILSQTVSNQ